MDGLVEGIIDGFILGLSDGCSDGVDEGDKDGTTLGIKLVEYTGALLAFSPPVPFPCLSSVLSSSSICKYRRSLMKSSSQSLLFGPLRPLKRESCALLPCLSILNALAASAALLRIIIASRIAMSKSKTRVMKYMYRRRCIMADDNQKLSCSLDYITL